jgi:hypothetical protein
VEIASCLIQTSFFGKRSGVDDEDDGADVLGISELSGRIVAEFSVAGCVEEEEAARALEGRVAGGAIV